MPLSEELLLLLELDAIGLLGQRPSGVAAAAYLKGIEEGNAVSLHSPHPCQLVLALAGDELAIEGLDVERRQVGELRQVLCPGCLLRKASQQQKQEKEGA